MKINKQNKSQITVMGPSKDFESIKKLDENGVEYWTARELLLVLGYSKWQRFEEVINRAKQSCVNSRQFPQDHFTDAGKMVGIGSNTVRKVEDYKLDRYACYLIAQNGDSRKREIALAQTYFAVQTRKQEILKGDMQAQNVHFKVGAKIRETIQKIGNDTPENLKPEKHIKQLKKEIKRLGTTQKTLK